MYSWVSGTKNPLAGKCPFDCRYCFVKDLRKRSPSCHKKYSRELRLDNRVMSSKVHAGDFFLCSCNDLFAAPVEIIHKILNWANKQNCKWIIQTKNPSRAMEFELPIKSIIGTTIETNRADELKEISKAPPPEQRAIGLSWLPRERFVTIEPILDFDLDEFLFLIGMARPDFINIGADSKNHGLPEPSADKIHALIYGITKMGIPIRQKKNLKRLLK